MNTKHTPGPWRVDPDHFRDVQTTDGAIEICLAEGGEPYGKNLFSVPPIEEAHANARLIAAAPDLLEALKAILEDMDSEHGTDYDYAKARAAIAKATGEA
jgi:hypothetical protein